MAVLIVDGFEAVHIKKHDAEWALRTARAIQFRFQDADEAAIVGQASERIADGQRAHLVEQAGLIEQGTEEHHDVACGFAQFSEEERSIQKMAGKSSCKVARYVERRHDEKRIVVQRSAILFFPEAAA